MLKIYLFGESRFILTESPEKSPRINLGNMLMAYLIRAKQPVSRFKLASTFWPHLSRSDSRTYLRNVLSRLKDRYSPWLKIERHTLEFIPNKQCWVDLYELDRAVSLLSMTQLDLLSEREISKLENALQLYTGPFLNNYSHYKREPIVKWLKEEHQEWATAIANAWVQLTRYYLAKNQILNGIMSAEQVISINPNMPSAWHLLMKAHLKQDDMSKAINVYKKYSDMGLDQSLNNQAYQQIVESYSKYSSTLA